MRSRCGIVDPVTLSLVALIALAAGVFGTSWKPLEFLKPKPPTEELTRLQGELDAQKKAAAEALAARDAAVAAERAALEDQVRAAQQDNAGTIAALGKVPEPHKTAEVKLAAAMANRVSVKLASAIGALPATQQAEMMQLIDQALSEKQAEVDAAMEKLAIRDAEFADLVKERDQIKAQIPLLSRQVEAKQAELAEIEKAVTAKTDEVKRMADQLDAKAREAGSIGTALNRVLMAVAALILGYFFLTVILPGLVKHLDSGPLKNTLRAASGYLTNPLLYHDASKKLKDYEQRLSQTPFAPK